MSKVRFRGIAVIKKLVTSASTIVANLVGNVTGNVTGDVTGNVTGDVTGDLTGGVKHNKQVMSADAAITIKSGIVVVTKAGVCAMTLAAPTATTDDGKVLVVDSHTANAHTLTVTGGLRGAGAGADVGTFGGAIGDGVSLYAYQGAWYVVPGTNLNVTFA